MWSARVVGDHVVAEGDEVCSGQRLGHAVGFLGRRRGPNEFELLAPASVVLSQEVVADADVAGVLGCRVIVSEVYTRFVVLPNDDWALDELSRDALYDVDDPEEYSGDERESHVFGLCRA